LSSSDWYRFNHFMLHCHFCRSGGLVETGYLLELKLELNDPFHLRELTARVLVSTTAD
jgi:hypothetical protein